MNLESSTQTKQLSVKGTKVELKGEGWSAANYWSPQVFSLLAVRTKAALLFWFFGDFRCGALLFMVILVIYKYKNR